MKARKLVVIGVGQSMRGDDAAGLIAVQTWKDTSISRMNKPEIIVELAELPGLSLLDLITDTEYAILVDAIHSGGIAGTLHLLQVEDLHAFEGDTHSAHGWGVAETLRLGHDLFPNNMPTRVILIGIEGDNFDVGAPLSEAVLLAIHKASALIERHVQELYQF